MTLRFRTAALLTVAAAAGVALGWVFGLPELAALAVAGWTALAVSALWLLGRGRAPAVRAEVSPPAVSRGEPAMLELTFSCPDRARSSAPTRVYGRLGTAGDGILAVKGRRSGTPASVTVELPTPERGLVQIGPLSAITTDPLGWWRKDRDLGEGPTLVVRPRVHPLGQWPAEGGRLPAPGRRSGRVPFGADADEDIVGLRPYVRGDDLRRIHWRTSARRNEPHVVQVEPPVRSPSVTVVLDQHPGCSYEAFERAVEAAASILTAAASAGREIRLVGTQVTVGSTAGRVGSGLTGPGDSETLGPGAAPELLDTLATVARASGADLATTLDSLEAEVATVVVCSGVGTAIPPGYSDRVDLLVSCGRATEEQDRSIPVIAWDGTTSLGDRWSARQHPDPRVAT